MFHSKQDVDRHVNEVFKNIKSEYQRNSKCFQIAKLYYKFKDYKSAIKYINRYILTTPNSAGAHRLLGECYLGVNLKVKAIDSFKTSLELNGSQKELVHKICTLLMDPDVSAVTPRATYWLERAETLFPTNPVVFQLREHILKSNLDGKQDNGQLEKLILSEISARPADVTVRIRLLNFFLDTKRFKIAYQHALEIEDRNTFSNDLRWYDCLCNIFQAYEKANYGDDFGFFIKKIIFFERRVDLSMQEFQEDVKTIPECCSALFAFDQSLHAVSKIEVPQNETYFFAEFMKHMRAQLSFHLATLALKRAKKEYGIWPKAFRTASPLLLQATQNTMDLEEAWYNMWDGKHKMEKEIKQLNKSATFRISQAGHVLLAWSQSRGSKFLEKVSQFCGGKWQNHVYQDVFYNREHQQATNTSHFINDPFFANVPMRLLTETELNHYDDVSQSAYPDSLHHLVWLGLAYCNANGYLSQDFRCTTVPDLQFTVANLNHTGPETLNQLDVDAFLYASVICAKSATPTIVSSDRPSRLPVSISEELCSPAQADWWVAFYKTYTNQNTGNIADLRLKLRKGIEVIRIFGQHGLHVKIIVMLAKLFQERATKNKNPNELNGLEERAYLYWTAAIPLLERIEKNQQLREVPNRLFDYRGKELTLSEVKEHLEEGRLYLACRLMKLERHEQAIEAFQQLKSPYATFYQALIYEKLASEEVNHRPESITSENRSQHIILLTRARDALYLTLDRLRSPLVDRNHPLNAQLQDHLDQVEKQLAMIDPESNMNRNGDSQSDETDTAPGPLSPDVDENLESSFNIYNTSNFLPVKNSTSRTLRQNLADKHHSARFEARPSPERLDAQLRHLIQANSNGLQAIVEQLKEMRSTVLIELKDLGCVTRDLLAEMKRWNDKQESMSKRAMDLKPEDLFELRDEDYEDISQLSQPYTSYQNYPVNRQMTGTQGTSTVTYGTSVPSPVPHVQPVIPTPENPLLPQAFYPGTHPVSSIDPSLLLYQSLGYYAPGMPYGENQNVPDYRGTGIQKGVPFAKNSLKVPDTVPNSTVLSTKPQPPNVVITSSDTLPAFTSAGTPAMSVTVPAQHIRWLTPSSLAQKPAPGQVHPYQIQMPPQAHVVKESPTEKLNSLIPTSASPGTLQTALVSGVKPTPIEQKTPLKESGQTKSITQINKTPESTALQEQKFEGNKLFESRGNLSVFDKEWKDKGVVLVKILHDEKLGKVRLIALQEPGFIIHADHFITLHTAIEPALNCENGWTWVGHGSQTSFKPNERTRMNTNFRIQFNTLDESRDFEYAFNEARRIDKEGAQGKVKDTKPMNEIKGKECLTCKARFEGIAEKCSICESKEKANDKTNLGGFTFTSKPIVKPPVLKLNEQKEKPKEQPKPSPFAEFSFTSALTTPTKTDAQPKTTTPSLFNIADSTKNSSTNATGQQQHVNIFAVQPDPNSFKRDANFKDFEGKDSLVFGYLNKPKTPAEPKKTGKTEDDEEGDEEFVPTAEFTPVVELPDLVDVKTGEENDKVLYDERVKLLRFDKALKEWKERGVGNMRVLLNEETGKVRLIMRRELVLKVCCNHYLDEKMEFKKMRDSERALTWFAQDYSEGEIKGELFALKFANPDSMNTFRSAIEKAQSNMKDGRLGGVKAKDTKPEKSENLKPLSEQFKPKPGSWECECCLIRNEETATKCVSCTTPKPGTQPKETAPASRLGTGITFPSSGTNFTFGIPQSTGGTSLSDSTKFSFGVPQTTSTTATTTFTSNIFGGSLSTTTSSTSPATKFSFGIPQANSSWGSTATTNKPATTSNLFTATTNAPAATSNLFGATTNSPAATSNLFGATTNSPAATSNLFGATTNSPAATSNLFAATTNSPVATSNLFGTTTNKPATTSNLFTATSSPHFTFGKMFTLGTTQTSTATSSSTPSTFSFSVANTTTANSPSIPKAEDKSKALDSAPQPTVPLLTSELKPVGKEKFEFSLNIKPTVDKEVSPNAKTSPQRKAGGNGGSSDESEDEGGEDDSGDHTIVKPIVPLPDKVALHTGEEDEDVMYEVRAKLFRFSDKEWKERGIGCIKILKHKTNDKIRLLMRRETILKVCLNHYVTPDIEFMVKDEKTWTWSAADFSDGEVQYSMFAIRFKTPEIAQEFKQALDNVKNKVVPSQSKAKPNVTEKAKEPTAAMKNFTFTVPNEAKPETVKSSQSNTADDDILVVYENKVTPEQRQKAMSLHLPPNFYAYLQAPDCPGCPGCDEDDAPVQTQQNPPPDSTSNMIFGTKPWGSLNLEKENISQRKLFTFEGNQGEIKWNPIPLAAPKLTQEADDKDEDEDENEEEEEDKEEDDEDDGGDEDEDEDDDVDVDVDDEDDEDVDDDDEDDDEDDEDNNDEDDEGNNDEDDDEGDENAS